MPLQITGPARLALGLVIGLVFGFLLHKGRLSRYEVIVNFFRLKDGRLIKTLLSAIVVGALGFYLFDDLNLVNAHLKETVLAANIIGGILMGIGIVMLGYCPGTAVAAAGSGSIHALFGIIGGLAGVALYAETYEALQTNVLSWGKLGTATLPEVFKVNHWVVIAIMVPFVVMLMVIIELAGKLQSHKQAEGSPGEMPPEEPEG